MRRDVFQAIADPTRRAIIAMISKERLNLNTVSEGFNISRPAVSKHIKILKECGLINIEMVGRERFCIANLEQLKEVSTWIDQYKDFWNKKLDSLESYLSEIQNHNIYIK